MNRDLITNRKFLTLVFCLIFTFILSEFYVCLNPDEKVKSSGTLQSKRRLGRQQAHNRKQLEGSERSSSHHKVLEFPSLVSSFTKGEKGEHIRSLKFRLQAGLLLVSQLSASTFF